MDILLLKLKNGLKGANITFPSISVGATENAILAAFNASGKTILSNCAIEPELNDLIQFLNNLGGKIKIQIENFYNGLKKLKKY